ncbi:MAG: CorA family divalent cation transporter [Rubrobacteraceae bacterium]
MGSRGHGGIRGRQITGQIETFRELRSNILGVNLALVGIQQGGQTKKVSAWTVILTVPTIITGIYGTNFRYMPELNWLLGYPFRRRRSNLPLQQSSPRASLAIDTLVERKNMPRIVVSGEFRRLSRDARRQSGAVPARLVDPMCPGY